MTAIRKHRWVLRIVGILVLAVVVGVVVFREDLKDVPRLVIVGEEHANGQKWVLFRLDAPKHKSVGLVTMSMVSLATGTERRPMLRGVGGFYYEVHDVQTPQGRKLLLGPTIEAEAGQSTGFSVLAPVGEVRQLRCEAALMSTSMMRGVATRLKRCWQTKSLAPLSSLVTLRREMIGSNLITNAMPRTADAPAK